MSGHWRRLGLLPLDTAGVRWAASHVALPIVESTAAGERNVYVTVRDSKGRSRVGRTRLTLEPTPRLAPIEPEPILEPGPLGAFDDSGAMGSCMVAEPGRRCLFYTGWSLGITVPFYLTAGMAVSDGPSAPFKRLSAAPLLERTAVDPFLTASPFVMIDNGVWRMWYVSATEWRIVDGAPRHNYHIRYAESPDGNRWTRDGRICIDFASPDEYAFARPVVIRDPDLYRMWYAFRGDRYHIGYAESRDGLNWTRRDDVSGLRASGEGWDSDMVAYPWVFDAAGRRYMLYNGNDYGRTGVGLAVME